MRLKIIAFALLFLLLPGEMLPRQAIVLKHKAASTQVSVLSIPVGNISGVNKYSNWTTLNASAEASTQIPWPLSGPGGAAVTITELSCSAATAPSGGSNILSFMKNGVAQDTCTIANGQHKGTKTVSISISDGDLFEAKETTHTTNSQMSMTVRVEGVESGQAAIPFGGFNGWTSGTTRYFTVSGAATGPTPNMGTPFPLTSGTITGLYVGTDVNAGAGEYFTVCDMTADSACTSDGAKGIAICQITSGQKTQVCSGLSGSLSGLGGHIMSAAANNTSGSTATFGGFAKVTGLANGVSIAALDWGNGTGLGAGATGYFGVGNSSTSALTDVSFAMPVGGTAAGIYGVCPMLPTSTGHSFTLNLNDSASALTFLTGSNRWGSDEAHTAAITRDQNASGTAINSSASAGQCGMYLKVTGTT